MNAITRPIPPRPMPEIQIGRVSVGVGNCDRRQKPVFAEADVRIGPFRFRAFLRADGSVDLPHELDDPDAALEIAVRVRALALDEATKRWKLLDEHEAQHLAACRALRHRQIGKGAQ